MDLAGKNMGDRFQFVEIDLIPAVGISATLTNRFHWNRPDSIIEIYVPIETVAKNSAGEKSAQRS
jgi:hypothetical protein